ncbi:uncharacterized protein LOC26527448 [Drosophila mojavensis]|uniref:Uncharacterized protein n=1 Tax=Drosophila mojavensis TaxID=7230 RepID=A0A0Q9XFY9_DROMO|nr:uncharacterized protein LOC26527448 [Drosophila mojavensis]XP_043864919.1 uncharacterized protein LOC26527448 [Drosophila mojavensis]KRG03089.1 uncharacterized protein Dmoj_GI25807 [Drosophila mojavensis]
MSWNWIILIFFHGTLAAKSKKLITRSNLYLIYEKYILAKMDAVIGNQFGHYENNTEYSDFYRELIVVRQSEKPISEKESEINKFERYNKRRLDLEEQMESRVSYINNEMLSVPRGHHCMKFYLHQKVALETAYTKKNEYKQYVVHKNKNRCPFKYNSSDNNEEIYSYNKKKFIIEQIDAQMRSEIGHYKNNREYYEYFSDLIIEKETGLSISRQVYAIKKFQKYNRQRLDLEEQMEDRVSDIKFEIESLPKTHKCMRFYLKQVLILERSYTKKNVAKEEVLKENSIPCPFLSNSNNQDQNSENNHNATATLRRFRL